MAHLYGRRPVAPALDVAQVVHGTARVNVKQMSGPIKVAGSYVFTQRLDGLTALQASPLGIAKFPRSAAPALATGAGTRSPRTTNVVRFQLDIAGLTPPASAGPGAAPAGI
jgi:hypothetical protein